jgi:chemotaxis protein CheD
MSAERCVIGIGGLEVRQADGGVIITHALGSCLGIAVHDPVAKVGGMAHAQLPLSAKNPERARQNPALFVDLAIGQLYDRCFALGGDRRRLRLTVAGAANITSVVNDLFNISKQNLTVLRKILWQNNLLIQGEDTGGNQPRNMTLDLATGTTAIESGGRRYTI